MRCRQVRKALDHNRLGEPGTRLAILAHSEGCARCRESLDSAAVATLLIKAQAGEEIEPSPFFKTRVLAAIRERGAAVVQLSPERMWRSTRAIVASMFVVVIVLLALNLLASPPTTDTVTGESARGGYSVERVVMDDNGAAPDENLTSGQVLDTVFAQGDSYGID